MSEEVSLAEVAAALGCPAHEVVAVEQVDGDVVITTFDGAQLVLVDPSNPDGAGQDGLMLWRRPDGKTNGAEDAPVIAFPVFVPRRSADDAVAEGPGDGSAELDPAEVLAELPRMKKADVVAVAAALGVDLDGVSKVDEMRARLAAELTVADDLDGSVLGDEDDDLDVEFDRYESDDHEDDLEGDLEDDEDGD